MNTRFGWFVKTWFVCVIVLALCVGGLLPAAAQATGSVTVSVADGSGNSVTGGCVLIENQPNGFLCDGRDDGTQDGRVTFTLAPGTYNAVLTFPPQGYIAGARASFTVVQGGNINATITAQLGGRWVFVETVDANNNPIGQACYMIYTAGSGGQLGALVSANCDAPQGYPGDGRIDFPGIAPGDYIAVETLPPPNYSTAANAYFSVPTTGTEAIIVPVVHEGGSFIEQLIAVLKRILQSIIG